MVKTGDETSEIALESQHYKEQKEKSTVHVSFRSEDKSTSRQRALDKVRQRFLICTMHVATPLASSNLSQPKLF